MVSTGTVSCLRLRGATRPCYNVIEVTGTHVAIWRRYPFHGQERIIQFDLATLEYEKYTGPHRARGDPAAVRAVALIDGEHYPDVVREALEELPYEWVGRDPRRRARRSCAATPTTACRSLEDFGDAEAVVDLSDEPVLGPEDRFRWASQALAAGLSYIGADFRFDPPVVRRLRAAVDRRDRRRQARGEDRALGAPRLAARARARRRRGRDGPRRPGRARGDRAAADRLRPRRGLARRAARRLRLPRDRRDLRRAHDRLPPRRRRARGPGVRLERRRGRAPRGRARAGRRRLRLERRVDPADRGRPARAARRRLARRRLALQHLPPARLRPRRRGQLRAARRGDARRSACGRSSRSRAASRSSPPGPPTSRTSTPTSSTSRRASPTATRCAASSRGSRPTPTSSR